jgi:hypothetical protein
MQAVGRADAARKAWLEACTILDELHHLDAERIRVKLDGLAGQVLRG